MPTAKELIERVINDPTDGPPVPKAFANEIERVVAQVAPVNDPLIVYEYAGVGRKRGRPIAYVQYGDRRGSLADAEATLAAFEARGYDAGIAPRDRGTVYVQR